MNSRYQIILYPPAERFLRKAPRNIRERLFARLRALCESPWQAGSTKLVGADAYRIRVGDYRIIYKVDGGRLVVLVLDVGHRKDIYRGM